MGNLEIRYSYPMLLTIAEDSTSADDMLGRPYMCSDYSGAGRLSKINSRQK